jgi:hypothetical protein
VLVRVEDLVSGTAGEDLTGLPDTQFPKGEVVCHASSLRPEPGEVRGKAAPSSGESRPPTGRPDLRPARGSTYPWPPAAFLSRAPHQARAEAMMTISCLIAVVTGTWAVIDSGETQGPFARKMNLSRTDPGAARTQGCSPRGGGASTSTPRTANPAYSLLS